MDIEQGNRSGWVDDGVWERLVLLEPCRVVARRPSRAAIPARQKSKIPPRVRSRIPSRVKRAPAALPLAA